MIGDPRLVPLGVPLPGYGYAPPQHPGFQPGYGQVLPNPLLAIVGNPHDVFAHAEQQLAEAERRQASSHASGRKKSVAGAGRSRRVKSKGVVDDLPKRVLKNRTQGAGSKPMTPVKTFPIDEARDRFQGISEAERAFRKFHGQPAGRIDLYAIDDGSDEVKIEHAHAALHRTIDTNYFVPWDSNKRKNRWKHEHVEGYDLKNNGPLPPEELFPLEILDPKTGTTRKIAGRFKVREWWYD